LVDKYGSPRSQAKNISRLSLGRPALATKFLKNQEYLQARIDVAKSFISLFDNDMNASLRAIGEVTGAEKGQKISGSAREIINIWESVGRDLLLAHYGHNDLIQNEALADSLTALKEKIKLEKIIEILQNLRKAKDYLAANVNARLAFEYVAINI
jgi:hypothetical protein